MNILQKRSLSCPDKCGVVGWVSSGLIPSHTPELWFQSVRAHKQRQLMDASLSHPCFSPSLSPSLPLSLEINKFLRKEKRSCPRPFGFPEATHTWSVSGRVKTSTCPFSFHSVLSCMLGTWTLMDTGPCKTGGGCYAWDPCAHQELCSPIPGPV